MLAFKLSLEELVGELLVWSSPQKGLRAAVHGGMQSGVSGRWRRPPGALKGFMFPFTLSNVLSYSFIG